MTILYINVIEENAPWGAECFVDAAFNKLGHKTITLDYRKYREELASKVYSLKDDFDVLFLQRGEGFPIDILESVKRPRFFWASELVSRNRDQDRLLSSGLFSHVFVHSQACLEKVVKNGWLKREQVSVLLNGFDKSIHRPLSGLEKDIEVLFIGNILSRREEILKNLTQKFSLLTTRAFGNEMNELFNRAKIVLNIHAEEYLDTETRVFEVLGAGGFLISETLSTDNPFIKEEHYVEVDSIDELEKKIRYYLEANEARDKIAEQGYIEATSKHSYLERAEYIAELFSRYKKVSHESAIDIKRLKRLKRKESIDRRSRILQSKIDKAVGLCKRILRKILSMFTKGS